MEDIPNIVGYKLESALSVLDKYNYNIVLKETLGKKSIKSDEIRVVRQRLNNSNVLQLIIAYF